MSISQIARSNSRDVVDFDADLLTFFESRLRAGQVFEVMGELNRTLRSYRSTMAQKHWASFIESSLASHSIQELLRRSPFSGRASLKPRGYAGDAVMIDMIYGDHSAINDADRLSSDICKYELSAQSCEAVRARRRYAEHRVAQYGMTRRNVRVLSLACGHLREVTAESLNSFADGFEIVAFDQDADSLDVVARELPDNRVRIVNSSVPDLISDRGSLGTFDFIYSLGLYDYLDQRVAKVLTKSLIRLLRPRGELLIANFAPDLLDVGYMEAIMDWWLVYRDESLVQDLLSGMHETEYSTVQMFRDPHEAVVYLNITK